VKSAGGRQGGGRSEAGEINKKFLLKTVAERKEKKRKTPIRRREGTLLTFCKKKKQNTNKGRKEKERTVWS